VCLDIGCIIVYPNFIAYRNCHLRREATDPSSRDWSQRPRITSNCQLKLATGFSMKVQLDSSAWYPDAKMKGPVWRQKNIHHLRHHHHHYRIAIAILIYHVLRLWNSLNHTGCNMWQQGKPTAERGTVEIHSLCCFKWGIFDAVVYVRWVWVEN